MSPSLERAIDATLSIVLVTTFAVTTVALAILCPECFECRNRVIRRYRLVPETVNHCYNR